MKWLDKLTGQKGAKKRAFSDPAPIRIGDYLTKKQILYFRAGQSKRQVFGSLIAALDLTDPSAALKAILAREEAGSTVVAPGLALPHARISGIRRLKAAIAVCPSGISDHRTGALPLNVFVLFLGPAENMKEHLGFLAAVSALFQRPNVTEGLLKQASPEAALAFLKQEESKLS